jgi:hypothetical protein
MALIAHRIQAGCPYSLNAYETINKDLKEARKGKRRRQKRRGRRKKRKGKRKREKRERRERTEGGKVVLDRERGSGCGFMASAVSSLRTSQQ